MNITGEKGPIKISADEYQVTIELEMKQQYTVALRAFTAVGGSPPSVLSVSICKYNNYFKRLQTALLQASINHFWSLPRQGQFSTTFEKIYVGKEKKTEAAM